MLLAQLPPLIGALICFIIGSLVLYYAIRAPFPDRWGVILFVTYMYIGTFGEVMRYYHNPFAINIILYGSILFFSLLPICAFISYRYGDEERKNMGKKAFKKIGAIFLAYLILFIIVILFDFIKKIA